MKSVDSAVVLEKKVGEVEKATLAKTVPDPKGFLFELKYDGYRFLAIKSGKSVRLVSRNGHDWAAKFPQVVEAVAALGPRELVIDGEVCALDERGVPSFNRLQNASNHGRAVYFVFDLLWRDGEDFRAQPIEVRRDALAKVVGRASKRKHPVLSLSAAVDADPARVLSVACQMGFEGIVAKRRASRYLGGRTKDWLKIKCTLRQELAIVGYLPFRGTKNHVGALLLGVMQDGELHFAGRVGTGFDDVTRRELAQKLDRDLVDRPAIAGAPRIAGAHWVKPKLVAEVAFTEWTPEGKIRHPSFQGLRIDKKPNECVREEAVAIPSTSAKKTVSRGAKPKPKLEATKREAALRPTVLGIGLSHPDRVLFHHPPRTKLDLARYYEAIGEHMSRHVEGRPLTLVRLAEHARGMFMRHAKTWGPPSLRRVPIREKKKMGEYLIADDATALVALAQWNILELHTWNATDAHLEQPDRIVIDLDPGPLVPWARTVEAARLVRARLADLGLEAWLKTTGGKGLHVVVPLLPRASWDECVEFARNFAAGLVREAPRRYSVSMPKAGREDKVFLDYFRNVRAGTSVAAFSPRARPGAPVSTPIAWDELGPKLDPSQFTMDAVVARVAGGEADVWEGYFTCKQKLDAKKLAAVT